MVTLFAIKYFSGRHKIKKTGIKTDVHLELRKSIEIECTT
jgi:hypothetical protein